MKYRKDFVTNSSSTAYIITNLTDGPLTVEDFALENIDIFDLARSEYNWWDFTNKEALKSAKNDYDDVVLYPGDNIVYFGDNDGTVLGEIYDYCLRDGGNSKRFIWKYHESCR